MKNKTVIPILGVLLVVITLILCAVQNFGAYSIYGTQDYKGYFYELVEVISLVGLILTTWPLMKTEAPAKPKTVSYLTELENKGFNRGEEGSLKEGGGAEGTVGNQGAGD
ncbi:MAG: hypothetical protein ACUVQY_09355 [Thermoproteota archaeon]